MQLAQTLSAASHAQAILSAWSANDAASLQRELGLLERGGLHSDPLEAERLDLLAGIAAELSHNGESAGICGNLLRHLATTPSPEDRWKLSPWALQ
jgi:hypothetical protein